MFPFWGPCFRLLFFFNFRVFVALAAIFFTVLLFIFLLRPSKKDWKQGKDFILLVLQVLIFD
jgi:hypothetical protein